MVIIGDAEPSAALVAAALATNLAIEISRGHPVRLISQGEHAIELDQLGDRVLDALEHRLEHRTGPGHPDDVPGPAHFSGSLLEQETDGCPSEPCTSATISPNTMMIDPPRPRRTA